LSNPKQDLIRYRMGRAREALADADAALREEHWNDLGVTNRAAAIILPAPEEETEV